MLQIEGKYLDAISGNARLFRPPRRSRSKSRRRQSRHRKEGRLRRLLRPSLSPFFHAGFLSWSRNSSTISRFGILIGFRRLGFTLTETWTTSNLLATKLELDNQIAKGLKAEALVVSQ